ncbi:MAG: glycosyltransferase [Bacteroidaceae bacterium]|nr:glycosyltransferase [Bacteroidaceae bacterium]
MKKKIFIAIHYLEIGGAEISLIGLLNAIDYTQYDVDLFVYSHRGELMKLIPPQVNLLPEIPAYSSIEKPIAEALKKGFFKLSLARLWAKVQYNQYVKKNQPSEGSAVFQYVADCVTPTLPTINEKEYDLAISFLTPHNIVRDKVNAKKKIAWIHTDYSYIDVDVNKELPVWSKFNYIASVSEDVTKSFLNRFPSLKEKIVLIENILSPAFVRSRAKQQKIDFPHEKNRINLLSIGRFTEAKNFDNVPDILRRIREDGINAYWYIIGYGGAESLIISKIKESGMEDYIILLGKQENPYPYLDAADIYVQPSRFEGKSVTVREAQMLCKPLVVTNYRTAPSQVNDGVDGVIVPLENESCAKGIVEFIRNIELQEKIGSYLNVHDYGNENEVQKIYQLLY